MKKLNNKGQAFTTILVIILLIISMVSLAYIIYDKVVTKENNQNPNNTGNNTNVVNKEVKVETATEYEYLVKNDVVALYIYTVLPEGGKGQPASGNGLYKYIYFYNIKTDKIIEKYSEAARLIEVQDLGIAKNYDDLDNYGCIDYSITNGTLKLVAEDQCV